MTDRQPAATGPTGGGDRADQAAGPPEGGCRGEPAAAPQHHHRLATDRESGPGRGGRGGGGGGTATGDSPAPWVSCAQEVTFSLDVSRDGRGDAPAEVRREAALERLATLPDRATRVWTDGSAEAGVTRGGGGVHILTATGEET